MPRATFGSRIQVLGALLLLGSGCAQLRSQVLVEGPSLEEAGEPSEWEPFPRLSEAPLVEADGRGGRIVQKARKLIGARSLQRYARDVRDDCAGFVTVAYRAADVSPWPRDQIPGENAVGALYRAALSWGTVHLEAPNPGDLVFFRETYDRNRDGRINDGLTHVGVVETVDAQGTVTFVHLSNTGVERSRFNPRFPQAHLAEGGELLNDYLRPAAKGSRAFLAGELFEGYAAPRPPPARLAVAAARR